MGKKVSISLHHETLSRFHALEEDEHDPAFDYNFSASPPIAIQSDAAEGRSSDASGSDYDDRFACDCEHCTPPSSNEDSGEEEAEDSLVAAPNGEDSNEEEEEEEEQLEMRQSRTSSGRSSVSSSLLIAAGGSLPKDTLRLPLLDGELSLAALGNAGDAEFNHTNLPRPRPRGSSIKELRQTKGVEYFDY